MWLEYLPDGAPDCPLIRLFGFTQSEVAHLAAAVNDLASGRAERIAVHEIPGVVPLGGCELLLLVRSWDQAVVRVGLTRFECGLTTGTWENIAGLFDPFSGGGVGHQWLVSSPGEARLLISYSGQW